MASRMPSAGNRAQLASSVERVQQTDRKDTAAGIDEDIE
jgi:hypothetical protein